MQHLTLRPPQVLGFDFLRNTPRANLYADMGLGKTATVLWLIRELELDNVLVIAPKRVTETVWPVEVSKWAQFEGMDVRAINGEKTLRSRWLLWHPRVSCINNDNVQWLVNELGTKWPFTTVIFDESTRLKGFRLRQGTKRARSLATIAHTKVTRWINLSGTPTPNGIMDLWGPQWFIDGGKSLGNSYSAFERRWMYMPATPGRSMYRQMLPLPNAQKEIEERMKPTTLTLRARDWLDIDEPIVNKIYVELPPDARKEYNRMKRHFIAELEGGLVSANNSAVKSSKLLQLANGAAYKEDGTWAWLHDAKIEALQSIREETAGANLFVAYRYVSDLARIKNVFRDAVDIRDAGSIERWNRGEIRMLLAHPKSAAHGLNLQHGGHHIVFFGDDWNLEEHLQVIERVGPTRQKQAGYDRDVYIYHIVARDTLDEAVLERQATKRGVLESILEAFNVRVLA